MIGHRDLHTTAANPNFEMGTLYVRQNSAANVALLDVPRRSGIAITRVWMRVTNCDGETADYDAVRTGTMWVVDVPGTHFATPGEVPGGVDVWASGDGADGDPYAWSIGTGSLCVREGDSGTPMPVDPWTAIKLRETAPTNPAYGDAKIEGGALYVWDGTQWVGGGGGGGGGIVDDTVTRTSSNAVKSSGIWSAIWGTLTALPTGFTALYDWVVDQLTGKADKSEMSVTTANDTAIITLKQGTSVTVITQHQPLPVAVAPSASAAQGAYADARDTGTALAGKQASITANGILKGNGSGGVTAAVAGTDYQSPLTIDATPTANSTNPVQSGGVKTALDGKLSTAGATRSVTAEDSGGTETYVIAGTGETANANTVVRIKDLPYVNEGEVEEMLVDVYAISSRGVQRHTAESGETSATFGFADAPGTGKIADAILDIDNSGNTSALGLEFYGLGTTFVLVPPDGDDLAEMTSVDGGKLARFYFTETALVSNNLPVISIQRITLGAVATAITRGS